MNEKVADGKLIPSVFICVICGFLHRGYTRIYTCLLYPGYISVAWLLFYVSGQRRQSKPGLVGLRVKALAKISFRMAVKQRVGDLQINQDMEHHHTMWVIQRVGWVVMALLLLLALAGLLGNGVVSHITAGEAGDALQLEWERLTL